MVILILKKFPLLILVLCAGALANADSDLPDTYQTEFNACVTNLSGIQSANHSCDHSEIGERLDLNSTMSACESRIKTHSLTTIQRWNVWPEAIKHAQAALQTGYDTCVLTRGGKFQDPLPRVWEATDARGRFILKSTEADASRYAAILACETGIENCSPNQTQVTEQKSPLNHNTHQGHLKAR